MQLIDSFKMSKLSLTQVILYCAFLLSGVFWLFYLMLNSEGVPVQDEIAHYLLSKHAWSNPKYMLNLWGRPIRVVAHMIPAYWSWDTARIWSILLTILTILTTTKIAQVIKIKNIALIPLFFLFQPWVGQLSFAVLPQIPFSLLLTGGIFYATKATKRNYILASILFGLLPMARHEGIVILGSWLIWLLFKRDFRAILVAITPFVLFNLVFYLVMDRFAFSIFFDSKPTTLYGSGGWLHYISPLPKKVGLIVLTFSIIGIFSISKKGVAILSLYAIYLSMHIIIYRFGLFASGGYQLFLLPIAPAFTLLAALGLDSIISWISKPIGHPALSNFIVIICAIPTILIGLQSKPYPLDHDGIVLREASNWIHEEGIIYPAVVTTHPWFRYFHDLPSDSVPPLDSLPAGSIAIWETHYADRFGIPIENLENSDGWVQLEEFNSSDAKAIIFQKTE